MKRFIVTGGYGFIGSNLIKLLLKKKFKVLNIDKLSYSAQKYNLKDIKSMGYKPFIVGFIAMLTVGIVCILTIESYLRFFI